MSAILKALKKLEKETVENGNAPLSAGIKARNKRRSKTMLVTALICFSLCILIGAGVMLFVRKSSTPEFAGMALKKEKPVPAVAKASPPENTQNRKADAGVQTTEKQAAAVPVNKFSTALVSPADNRLADSRNEIQESSDAQTKQPPAAAMPEYEFSTARVSPADDRLADSQNETREPSDAQMSQTTVNVTDSVRTEDPFSPMTPETAPEEETTQPGSENNEPAAEAETAQPAQENEEPVESLQPDTRISAPPVPAAPMARKAEPQLDLIKDPAVELQAISWSADASKRMAIINGQICREKDRVGAYVIDAINTGDVVLSNGSVRGKLVFKIR